jgi:hypothetical protein
MKKLKSGPLLRRRRARDGGDAVVRGETGDQTDQESRSAPPRAASSMTAMDITTTTQE